MWWDIMGTNAQVVSVHSYKMAATKFACLRPANDSHHASQSNNHVTMEETSGRVWIFSIINFIMESASIMWYVYTTNWTNEVLKWTI